MWNANSAKPPNGKQKIVTETGIEHFFNNPTGYQLQKGWAHAMYDVWHGPNSANNFFFFGFRLNGIFVVVWSVSFWPKMLVWRVNVRQAWCHGGMIERDRMKKIYLNSLWLIFFIHKTGNKKCEKVRKWFTKERGVGGESEGEKRKWQIQKQAM